MEAYRKRTGTRAPAPSIVRAPFSTATASNAKESDMSHPAAHHKINYIEFAATDVARAKQFYSSVFGWTFEDYGPDYASFHAAIGRHRRRFL